MNSICYQDICIAIYKHFYQTLQILFENEEDIPNLSLQIQFSHESQAESVQYAVNTDGILELKCNDMFAYIHNLTKTNYYGTFSADNYDALYYYKCSDTNVYIAFTFSKNNAIEFVKSLTKVFIESILKPLSKLLGYNHISERGIYYVLNQDFDAENIISKSATEFFWFLYNLDIHLISLLSAQKYETPVLRGRMFVHSCGAERSKRELKIRLIDEIKLTDNIRVIRKLMEMAKEPFGLVLGKNKRIMGYGSYCKPYECNILINGHLNWEAEMQGFRLIYSNGRFRIPSFKKRFHLKASRCF